MRHNILSSIRGILSAWVLLALIPAVSSCSGDPAPGEPAIPGGGRYALTIGGNNGFTRAELGDDRVCRWSPADQTGLYIASGDVPFASNVRFTSTNTEPAAYADFEGELTESQVNGMAADGVYDYYSYYPYNASAGGSAEDFPCIDVSLPVVRTVKPDLFASGCELMIAHARGRGPVTYLEGGEQKFGDRVGFSYSHVFSYAEIYLVDNPMSQRITRIKITNDNGGVLAGDCSVDIATGEYTISNSASTVTLDIEGGFDVLDGKIYLPIPAADMSSHTFSLEITTENGSMVSMSAGGANFQTAKVHKLGLRVPSGG